MVGRASKLEVAIHRHVTQVELVDQDWAKAIDGGLSRDATAFRIICPFIKEKILRDLLDSHRPDLLRVVTRFKLADFATGVSDIAALQVALEAGGRVRGLRGLHSKVFIFGNTRAAVTSANLTRGGLAGNFEFGCVSEQPEFLAACRAYFDGLWELAGPDLTVGQLQEWNDVLDSYLDTGGPPGAALGLPDFGAVPPAAPAQGLPALAPAGWPAESGQAFVKFFGEGHNRLDKSYLAFEEVKRSGCHWACTYPATKRPRAVRDGDTLFIGRLVGSPNDTMIFGRAIGRAHRPGKDEATPAEIEARPFKSKWPNYIRVHHAEFVAGSLGNGVSLGELMDDLESDAFLSTQQNASRGHGNTNPRAAFSQQAAVRLTPEAAAWVTVRLEAAFAAHGTVPGDELHRLDWPASAA